MTSDGQIEPAAARAPYVVALDIGTSSGRAAVFDAEGREVAETQGRVEWSFTTTREGGAETDADELLEQLARVVDETHARVASLNLKIEAVAISCFWHSLVGVDAAGRALTPLYGWADTRAALEVAELRRRFDEREVHARTGCRFHASYWPAKLLWLKREKPDVWRECARWLSFGEFLALRICGAEAASVSQASATGLFDQRRCVWDAELTGALGLRSNQLPPILPGGETTRNAFHVAPPYAARWPRLGACPWFAAVGDGAANNIGAGCVNKTSVALMIGTSGAMRVLYEGEPPDELPASLWCYRADRRRVLIGGALSDGGWLYNWMRESLNLNAPEEVGDGDEKLERELAALAPDAHGLTLLPFWAGERSTNWNPQASGAITGLTMHTRPVEIMRAALEAVAYRFAHIARALDRFAPAAEIRASGGALAASPLWSQMLADVLARPLHLSTAREASSRGAALLALESLGAIDHLADAPVGQSRTFEPDIEAHAIYRAGAERQEIVYQTLLKD
ncbi:MAG TPA: gluconokinase [Pyrinomonadaceae bacterium]|nr:gluconokinase [Pyrinomonadaceae bacterium]